MDTLTVSIGDRQAYVYQCDEHPECGPHGLFHVVDPVILQSQVELNDPEYYFVTSHIPVIWGQEWDWDRLV